jgi:AcrR family transcriptional regulator
VPKSRRSQEERSKATRAALIDVARRLFTERGYAAVSAEEIVGAAGVTRGALYHHFADKRDLFRAVFEDVERSLTEEISAAIDHAAGPDGNPAAGMSAGLGKFLDICERPEVIRVALTDAPAVLGWAEWRRIEASHGLGLIRATLESAASAGQLAPAPVEVLAHLVLSAMIEAALLIAHADDRRAGRAAAEQGLVTLMSGMLRPPG